MASITLQKCRYARILMRGVVELLSTLSGTHASCNSLDPQHEQLNCLSRALQAAYLDIDVQCVATLPLPEPDNEYCCFLAAFSNLIVALVPHLGQLQGSDVTNLSSDSSSTMVRNVDFSNSGSITARVSVWRQVWDILFTSCVMMEAWPLESASDRSSTDGSLLALSSYCAP